MRLTRAIPILVVLSVSSLGSTLAIVACNGSSTLTGPAELSPSFETTSTGRNLRATSAGAIQAFQDAGAFEATLKTSTVQTVSQDLSQTGTDTGGGTYELQLGGVRIQMQGPAFYNNFLGVDVLGKGVPVTIFFPPSAQGAGVAVAQISEVTVTARARDGETFVLDRFSNGTNGFLGFTSGAGIASIEFSDPDPSDSSTPITNLADITFGEVGPESLPLDCGVLGDRRPSARARVQGKQVTVTARALGVAVPAEVNVSPAIVGSVGRFRFWPNGRHREPKVTSEIFPTLNAQDFPVDVELRHRYPANTPPGEILAALDYELLSACFDDITGALEIGGIDEFGTCRPGEFVILQCDRGLSYVIN